MPVITEEKLRKLEKNGDLDNLKITSKDILTPSAREFLNNRKVEFINLKGGSCNLCGYNKNITALEFHHRDSSTKDFSIDIRKLANTKKETLLLELEKCDLICANCHREIHAGLVDLELLNLIL